MNDDIYKFGRFTINKKIKNNLEDLPSTKTA